jgi:DNA (cytosine-5)-methyltransferase 1
MNALTADAIKRKVGRLQRGSKLRVLDLFSGCGGLSLGFHAAGFKIAGALEWDKDAAKSHGINFHQSKATHCCARDITKTSPYALAESLELGTPVPGRRLRGGSRCRSGHSWPS